MKKKPVWLLVVLDALIFGAALMAFALFHHVLPREKASLGIVSVQAMETTAPAQIEPVSLPQATDSIEAVDAAQRLDDEGQPTLTLTEGSALDGTVQYYLADIRLSDISRLRTAFAQDTYGGGFTQTVLEMDLHLDAVLTVNGDYYGNSDEGVVARNGVIYRANPTDADILCLYQDGSMAVKTYQFFDPQAEANKGLWQAWTFGPSLLDEQAGAITEFFEGRHLNGKNPRTVLGYYEPGHYALLVVDGRGESAGLSLKELSALCQQLGFQIAYNLDGGKSSVMCYQDAVLNQPASGGRAISDVIYLAKGAGL